MTDMSVVRVAGFPVPPCHLSWAKKAVGGVYGWVLG